MEMMPSAKPLKTLDSVALPPLVRKALSHNDAVVLNWTYEALHGASFNSEIYRFSGNARNHEDILPWSLILKIVRSPDGKDDPDCLNYWKREALAYRSGLLDQLPPGLSAPRCLGIVEQPGLEVWLWLEDIRDELQASWSLEQYGQIGILCGVTSHKT